MNFSTLLVERVRKILFLSLCAAVVGLTVYGVIWSLHSRESSKDFILSHLKEIIVAGVDSQNTFNIDGELNRIVDSWSKTQDFPLRVDAFIDSKQWAHGGPMQSFGVLSATNQHSETLATGQKLVLDIDMDLSGPIFRLLAALALFIGFFVAVYFSLKKGLSRVVDEISKPLEDRVASLSEAAENLSQHAKIGFSSTETQVNELQKLDGSLNTLFLRIGSLENEVAEKKYSEGQFEMAKQVTHALNGSLSALSIYINETKPTEAIDKQFLSGIVNQITSISSDLTLPIGNNMSSVVSAKIFDLIRSSKNVVEQKNQEAQKLTTKQITIAFDDGGIRGLTLPGSKAKFEVALTNLITNSIEAIRADGIINVSIDHKDNNAIINIRDNGCGVSKEILPLLMKEGATFGKDQGHGDGLFHVKSIIEELHGSISISSEEGFGTEIKLEIPFTEVKVQKIEIVLFEDQQLIIVDDQEWIHQAWDIILKNVSDKIRVVHLRSDNEFENWMTQNNYDSFASRLFIFDYDLNGSMTGLDLIEKYQLMFESYLVTGMAKNIKVIEESKRLKVKTISKDELPNLHLRLEKSVYSQEQRFLEVTEEKEIPDGSHLHRSVSFRS